MTTASLSPGVALAQGTAAGVGPGSVVGVCAWGAGVESPAATASVVIRRIEIKRTGTPSFRDA